MRHSVNCICGTERNCNFDNAENTLTYPWSMFGIRKSLAECSQENRNHMVLPMAVRQHRDRRDVGLSVPANERTTLSLLLLQD